MEGVVSAQVLLVGMPKIFPHVRTVGVLSGAHKDQEDHTFALVKTTFSNLLLNILSLF
jgi:hypothetical protein